MSTVPDIIFRFLTYCLYLTYATYTFFSTLLFHNIEKNRLIIFTRYPQEGYTKKRMIPELGAKGAMELQQSMTSFILRKMSLISLLRPVEILVYYHHNGQPADYKDLMSKWLGSDLRYVEQSEGDLGTKMRNAFKDAIADGVSKCIIIGSDIPDIDYHDSIDRAYRHLEDSELVLGPAEDGGYYLIGLDLTRVASKDWTHLFAGIDWGTNAVFDQTIALARIAKLNWSLLGTLRDVDEITDLPVWKNSQKNFQNSTTISIIIPVLNESLNIMKTIEKIMENSSNIEIIVVDGGSTDDTLEICKKFPDLVLVESSKGRGVQMNAGASFATGEILFFLHGDSLVPSNFDTMIRHCLLKRGCSLGAFSFSVDEKALSGKNLLERMTNWRANVLQLPYGDQGIFLYKKNFIKLNGFLEIKLMEDFEFVTRCQKLGKVVILNAPIVTSARRYKKMGIFNTTLTNQMIIVFYYCGVAPETLSKFYYS
jgi:rSAM/selenodomain-associated transferase 2/rSAM/selenodomain-associated transferase 1